MTVSTTSTKVSYSGNGATTAFAFTFLIFDETDIRVIEKTVATGVEVVKTLTTDYTVSSPPYTGGGTVTMLTAPASGVELIIKSDIPETQPLDLADNDSLPAEEAEEAYDRAVRLIQQLLEQLGRSLQLPEGDTSSNAIPNAVDRANKFLFFDSDGALSVGGGAEIDTTTVAVTSFAETFLDDVDAAAVLATLGAIGQAVLTTEGDTLYRDATGAARLAKGVPGQFYRQSNADAPDWATLPVVDGFIAAHENLVLKNNAANPNFQVDIDADALIVNDDIWREKLTSVNVTADITASGVNGLDTGSEANSTWYYIWVINNGTTTASLLSTSSSSPTMPSGYTFKALVGAVYNDSGGNFSSFQQKDNLVAITSVVILSSGGSPSLLPIDLSAVIPIGCKRVSGEAALEPNLTASSYAGSLQPLGSGTLGQQSITHGDGVGTYLSGASWQTLVLEDQTIYYMVNNANADFTVRASSYEW